MTHQVAAAERRRRRRKPERTLWTKKEMNRVTVQSPSTCKILKCRGDAYLRHWPECNRVVHTWDTYMTYRQTIKKKVNRIRQTCVLHVKTSIPKTDFPVKYILIHIHSFYSVYCVWWWCVCVSCGREEGGSVSWASVSRRPSPLLSLSLSRSTSVILPQYISTQPPWTHLGGFDGNTVGSFWLCGTVPPPSRTAVSSDCDSASQFRKRTGVPIEMTLRLGRFFTIISV